MAPSTIATREVASMLGVTETTVKRWADEGVIPCVRTPGGHRKFLLKDVVEFAQQQGLTVAGVQPPPMSAEQTEQLRLGVALGDFSRIANVLKEEALQADRQGLLSLLLYLTKSHIGLPIIADEVIRPAFTEIGELWMKGKLGVNQEHAATQAMLEALIRVAGDLHHKPGKEMAVVCAGPEHELHEIGLRCLAYSLEGEGWDVHYIGANTPLDAMLRLLRTSHPQLVCISITIVRRRKELQEFVHRLYTATKAYGGTLIIGGQGAQEFQAKDLRCDFRAKGIQDTIEFIKDKFQLRPGPKKELQHGTAQML